MDNKRKYTRYATKEKLDKISYENKMHIEKYFNNKSMILSDSSKNSYLSDFNQFLIFITEKKESGSLHSDDILKILRDDDGVEDMADIIEDYIAFCSGMLGNNERRMQRRLSSLSSFFLYLIKKRRIKANPLEYIERPKVKAGEKLQIKQTFLTKEQVETIRKVLKKQDNLQLTCFFEVALSTMARVNALSNIKTKQIDFDKRKINDVLEKEGKVVSLFPSDKAVKLIKDWMKYRELNGIESEHLFITKYNNQYKQVGKTTIQNVWTKKIGDIVDIPEFHAHDLRHSGSNLLFHSGMSLETVSALLNHSGTDVTKKHYLQTNYDAIQEDKRKYEI